MRAAVMLPCVLCCAALVGCGSIGEPLYPAVKIPVRVADLGVVERGSQIDVTFTSPSQTTEGLAIKTVGKIDLRIGPNAGPGFNLVNWLQNADIVEVTPPSTPGLVLKRIPVGQYAGKDEVVAVRVGNEKGRFSDWSSPISITVDQPLSMPVNLKPEATPQGVSLIWTATTGATQYRIYRRTQDEQTPSPLATSDQANYVDATAEFDKRYDYYVEAIHDKTVSDVAGPVTITPKDTFPPAVPSGLNASAGVAAVELAWDRNTESDFKEYRVFRAEGDGPFAQIAAGIDAPLYSDTTVQSGKRYRYQLIAIDQLGNQSQPTMPVDITVP